MEKAKQEPETKAPEPSTTSYTADWLQKHSPKRKKRIAWFRKLRA